MPRTLSPAFRHRTHHGSAVPYALHRCTASRRPCQALVGLARAHTLPRSGLSPEWHGRYAPTRRRRAGPPPPTKPPLQTSTSFARATCRSPVPCRCFQTPAPLESAPGRPSLAFFGAAPPREHVSGELRRHPACPLALSHPIRDRRPRLERRPVRFGPRDRDPTA